VRGHEPSPLATFWASGLLTFVAAYALIEELG
jgi:hypothetical protein